MVHKGEIEIMARGVCVLDGALLLCHSAGADNTYLPGGHIDFGVLPASVCDVMGAGAV